MRKVGLLSAASTKYGKMPYTARDLALLAAKEAIESANNRDFQSFIVKIWVISDTLSQLGSPAYE